MPKRNFNYEVDPNDEAKSAKMLENPIIFMPSISVTGFVEDDEPHIVISFSDDMGQVLNFVIGDPDVAEDVGKSLIVASQRFKEIKGDPEGTKQ